MTRVNVHFALDKEVHRRIREVLGESPNKYLREILLRIAEMMELGDDEAYKKLRVELLVLKVTREILLERLRRVEQEISELEEHLRKQEEYMLLKKKDERMKELFREMNAIIVANDYDPVTSWSETAAIRKEMAELGFEIDRDWFYKHVERLKRWY